MNHGKQEPAVAIVFPGYYKEGMPEWIQEREDVIELQLRVVPRASKDQIVGVMGGTVLKVRIQAPPVDGKANAYLIKFLSSQWNIPRSGIEILSGTAGRNKHLRISNPSKELVKELLSINPC